MSTTFAKVASSALDSMGKSRTPKRPGLGWSAWLALLALPFALGVALIDFNADERLAGRHYQRGLERFDAGEMGKARLEFLTVLEFRPEAPEAFYQLGRVDEELGRHKEALLYYQAVARRDPKSLEAQAAIARMHLELGDFLKALESAEALLARDPSNPDGLRVAAQAALRLRRAEVAYTHAYRLVEVQPSEQKYWMLLAHAGFAKGGPELVHAALSRAIAALGPRPELILALSAAQLRLGDPQQARQTLSALDSVILPLEQDLMRNLLLENIGAIQPAEAFYLRSAERPEPDRQNARLAYIGFVARQRGLEAALRVADNYAASEVDPWPYRLAQVSALRDVRQLDRAATQLSKALQSVADPERRGQGVRLLAELYLQNRKPDLARAVLTELLNTQDADGHAHLLRGQANFALGDVDAALDDLAAAVQNKAATRQGLGLLAKLLVSSGRVESAEALLREWARNDQANPAARLGLGEFLMNEGRLADAREEFGNANEAWPVAATPRVRQVQTYLRERNYAAAMALAQDAVNEAPGSPVGPMLQGGTLMAQKEYAQAAKAFLRAHELAPGNVMAVRMLAQAWALADGPLPAARRLAGLADDLAASLEPVSSEKRSGAPDDDALGADILSVTLNSDLRGWQARARAGQNRPSPVTLRILAAHQYQDAGETASARAQLLKAQGESPDHVGPVLTLAAMLGDQGQGRDAIATARRALSLDPDSIPAKLQLADAHQVAGQAEAAIEIYEDLLRSNPEFDVIANNLAMLLLEHRSQASAHRRARDIMLARASAPNAHPMFLDTLGWAHFRLGELDQAVEILERAARALPGVGELRFHLGSVYYAQEADERARLELEAALSAGGLAPAQQKQTRAMLARLAAKPEGAR